MCVAIFSLVFTRFILSKAYLSKIGPIFHRFHGIWNAEIAMAKKRTQSKTKFQQSWITRIIKSIFKSVLLLNNLISQNVFIVEAGYRITDAFWLLVFAFFFPLRPLRFLRGLCVYRFCLFWTRVT
jgi:hypothetical protein